MDPRACLDGQRKSPTRIDPHTMQPVASHYIDYTLLAHKNIQNWVKVPRYMIMQKADQQTLFRTVSSAGHRNCYNSLHILPIAVHVTTL
jgi:hypothetical protein